MTAEERWEKLHLRLRKLDYSDNMEEEELVVDAYYNLVEAYQEARSLNSEMEELASELAQMLKNAGISF